MDGKDSEAEQALVRETLRETLSQQVTKAELFALIQPLWMCNVKLVSAILETMTSVRMLSEDNEKASKYAEQGWSEVPDVLEELEKIEPAIRQIFPGLVEAAEKKASKDEGPVNE
ncbi:hypothetical protein JTA33_00430 [Pseudomonas sp. 20GA0080]|uniref:hypothetical protein n=1 Tax=Pseudomonas alliivorans TaxID=2810613 RepID=UPI001AE55726|nr:hypothetical protein [Pseudomonas alliivorans]MBP0948914.1 hypothetical protein [Pseudomonas alliivorans]